MCVAEFGLWFIVPRLCKCAAPACICCSIPGGEGQSQPEHTGQHWPVQHESFTTAPEVWVARVELGVTWKYKLCVVHGFCTNINFPICLLLPQLLCFSQERGGETFCSMQTSCRKRIWCHPLHAVWGDEAVTLQSFCAGPCTKPCWLSGVENNV